VLRTWEWYVTHCLVKIHPSIKLVHEMGLYHSSNSESTNISTNVYQNCSNKLDLPYEISLGSMQDFIRSFSLRPMWNYGIPGCGHFLPQGFYLNLIESSYLKDTSWITNIQKSFASLQQISWRIFFKISPIQPYVKLSTPRAWPLFDLRVQLEQTWKFMSQADLK